MTALYTPWGEQLDRTCPLPEYPRPQLRRDSYLCLNGLWDYTVEDGDEYSRRRSGKILVPFSPESLLSGCDFRLQSGETLWYERTFTLPEGGGISKSEPNSPICFRLQPPKSSRMTQRKRPR